ncbi:hypothetical protein, partial [Pseudomonas cannabina]
DTAPGVAAIGVISAIAYKKHAVATVAGKALRLLQLLLMRSLRTQESVGFSCFRTQAMSTLRVKKPR